MAKVLGLGIIKSSLLCHPWKGAKLKPTTLYSMTLAILLEASAIISILIRTTEMQLAFHVCPAIFLYLDSI